MKLNIFEEKLNTKVAAFKEQINELRLGSFNIEALGHTRIKAYGSEMALRELANLVSVASSEVLVEPWDKSVIYEIEKGLREPSETGFAVSSEGEKFRLKILPLTAERREALIGEINRRKEEAKITIRLIRQDQMKSLDEMEEDGEISEDEKFRSRDSVETTVKNANDMIEDIARLKREQLSVIS